MKLIEDTFHNKKSIYRHRRISIEIERVHGVRIHKNTVNKYMRIAKLK